MTYVKVNVGVVGKVTLNPVGYGRLCLCDVSFRHVAVMYPSGISLTFPSDISH